MTVEVLHDYVTQRGGAERVALLLGERLGDGKLTTSVYSPEETHAGFADLEVRELVPGAPERIKSSRAALAPLAARAFHRHRAEADVVLCSSSGWAHWTSTPSPTVVYCYTPPRWFWAPEDYFLDMAAVPRRAARSTLHLARGVDRRKALRRTQYVAISTCVRDRIRASYGVDAEIVFPPVMIDTGGPQHPVEGLEPGFVLTVARDRGYKNVRAAQDAFRAGGLGQLVVVGSADTAHDGAVVGLGSVSEEQLRWLYAHCRAVLALSREDFGLTPVEGHLYGKPTVARRAGGYLDTCVEGVNAVFVDALGPEDVRRGVLELDASRFDEVSVRASADRFSVETFVRQMEDVISRAVRLGA